MPVLTAIPHAEFVDAVATLAARIAADAWAPSLLVGIGRGGLVPAVFLSHATGLPMASLDWSGGSDLSAGAVERLAARAAAGERLLLVDDINDSGRTVAALRRALADGGAPAEAVRVATLLDNIRSAERVSYAARTIDRQVVKDWFVFPWEAVAPPAAVERDAAEVPERTA